MKIIKVEDNLEQYLNEIVEVIENGGVVAVPTDTSYAFCVNALDVKALKRLFDLKGRKRDSAVSVFVKDLEMVTDLAEIDEREQKLFNSELMSGLTLLLKAKINKIKDVTKYITKNDLLGIRKIDTSVLLKLVQKLDFPLSATSANLSGKPNILSLDDLRDQFKEKKVLPELFIDTDGMKGMTPSTVVKIRDGIEIFRQGRVSEEEIKKVINKNER